MERAERAEHRAQAASMLEPIYLASANFERVMATLSTRLDYSQDPDERRELLGRLAKLHEEQKEDYAAALATVARLLEEDVTDQDTVRELERLARVADSGAELARIYAAALERVNIDEPATAKLSQRAAQLFAEHGDIEKSLLYYRRALEFDADDRQVFEELDALLARAGKHGERVELYSSALENRFEDAERISLLHQVAELHRGLVEQLRPAAGLRLLLHEVHTAARAAAYLVVPRDVQIVVAHVDDCLDHPRPDGMRVGEPTAAHAIAGGKVLLAGLRPGRLSELLGRSGLARLAPKTVADRRALDRELMRVRSDGAAVEVEEYQSKIAGVAAPVVGPDGEAAGAIGVSVSRSEFAARRWELERLVREAAGRAPGIALDGDRRLGGR